MAENVYFSDMQPNWLTNPDDLGIACLAIAIFLTVTSIVAVTLRMWIRFTSGALGIDDYLMAVATVSLSSSRTEGTEKEETTLR